MKTEEKLREVNHLNKRIKELKDFLWLCERGNSESNHKNRDGKNQKNSFRELTVAADLWTGSDNPKSTKTITCADDIELLVDSFIENLTVLIKKLEAELKNKLT